MQETPHTKEPTMSTTGPAAANPHDVPASTADFMAWLESMRVEHDLSWAEVARRSGVSENGLRKIRQGDTQPRPATVEALVGAFHEHDPADPLAALAAGHTGPLTPSATLRRAATAVGSTYLTVEVHTARAERLDPATAGRLIRFLQHSAQAWLATADCDKEG
jgi:transcriptional regulator with XRE-family HTH domain